MEKKTTTNCISEYILLKDVNSSYSEITKHNYSSQYWIWQQSTACPILQTYRSNKVRA